MPCVIQSLGLKSLALLPLLVATQPGESEVLSRPWTVYVTDPHSGLSVDLAGAKFGPSCFRPLCDLGVQGD